MKIRTLAIAVGVFFLSIGSAAAQWTGCGAGAGGAFQMVEAAPSGLPLPIGLGFQGEKAGLTLNCDYRMQAFVLGGEVNYDWFFGDANTVGAKDELSVMGRLGVLTSPANLLYVTAGWGRTDFNPSFIPTSFKVDSWKIGIGDEFRIPNSPMYLDLRATYSRYDETDLKIPSGVLQIDSLEAGARLKIKFGPGMFGGSGASIFSNESDPAPPCDPKLAGCKK